MAKPTKVFVIMPSGNQKEYADGVEEADFIYNKIIKAAVLNALGTDVEIIREIDRRNSGAIDKSIICGIEEADYCIVDLTGLNPNVFFELGIRYSLRKHNTILLMQQNREIIPFDVSHYRVVGYSSKYFKAEKAVADISAYLRPAAENEITDSLVYDALPDLRVERLGRSPESSAHQNSMPWIEFLEQCHLVESRLKKRIDERTYRPDILIGITNGGLIFAEILGRSTLFNKLPVLSFWANRYNESDDWFNNPYNEALISSISQQFPDGDCELMLLDDNVSSGSTYKKAVGFIKKGLPGARISFLPLFTRNTKYINDPNLIWKRPEFSDLDMELDRLHLTKRDFLPYNKELFRN